MLQFVFGGIDLNGPENIHVKANLITDTLCVYLSQVLICISMPFSNTCVAPGFVSNPKPGCVFHCRPLTPRKHCVYVCVFIKPRNHSGEMMAFM